MSEAQLHKIQLIHHEWQIPECGDPNARESFNDAQESHLEVAEVARRLGGHVIQVLQATGPKEQSNTDMPTFCLNINHDTYRGTIENLLQQHGESLPLLPADRVAALSDARIGELYAKLEDNGRFVLAYTKHARGHGKYLIDHSDQLTKVLQLQRDHPAMRAAFLNCEIQPFIETPSDYATSFRVDISAIGTMLSAGIIHSELPEEQLGIIEHDRWNDILPDDKDIRFLKKHFEDPDSPYFLAARDIRSNTPLREEAQKNIIPLLGLGRTIEIAEHQAQILDAYGIDPYDRRVPDAISTWASFVGRTFGPSLDLVIGFDFIMDKDSKRVFLKDVNPNAGTSTFELCHPQQGKSTSPYMRMRTVALKAIAREFNS